MISLKNTNCRFAWARLRPCRLPLEQDYNINLCAPSGTTRTTSIALSTDQIRLNAPNSYTNNSVVTGTINTSNGLILVVKHR
jgi:hypothetical protein